MNDSNALEVGADRRILARVPIDPINIDAVEISRGPNSSVFGIGNPSGTVNQVPASANLTRDRSQVQARVDSTRSAWGPRQASRKLAMSPKTRGSRMLARP